MTLLFFLRSPAGNTDTWAPGDAADMDGPSRRTRREIKEEEIEGWAIQAAVQRREEDELLLLFMHQFEGYEH